MMIERVISILVLTTASIHAQSISIASSRSLQRPVLLSPLSYKLMDTGLFPYGSKRKYNLVYSKDLQSICDQKIKNPSMPSTEMYVLVKLEPCIVENPLMLSTDLATTILIVYSTQNNLEAEAKKYSSNPSIRGPLSQLNIAVILVNNLAASVIGFRPQDMPTLELNLEIVGSNYRSPFYCPTADSSKSKYF